MSGQRQKDRDELAFKRGGRDSVVEYDPSIGELEFPLSRELLPETRAHIRQCRKDMAGFWRPTDVGQIVRYAETFDAWVRERQALAEEGTVEPAGKHGRKANPRLQALAIYQNELRALESTLGLSPQGRLRLGIKVLATASALERLRGGGPRRPPAKLVGASS